MTEKNMALIETDRLAQRPFAKNIKLEAPFSWKGLKIYHPQL
jgi:hypothetical protein